MTNVFRPAPTLETGRLRLRAWEKADRAAYWALLEEPAVYRYFGTEPASREDNWRRLMAQTGSWQINGFGGWAVTRRDDGRLLGMVSLFTAFRALDPDFGDTPEMGWIFATETHGQGLAGEACRAVLDWADANLQPTPIWAIISPDNAPSIRLAERLGFEHHNRSTYHDEPILVLQRPAKG